MTIPSPCIHLCTLDADDMCVGCGRTLDEIVTWTQVDEGERDAIVARAANRLRPGPKPPRR